MCIKVFELRLLGHFHLALGDQPTVILRSARERALLAYLCLHRDAQQRRQHVAFRLWPNSTEAQAQNNLRRTLHHLRRNLPAVERYLHVDHQTIQWLADESFTLDVADFETALNHASDSTTEDQSHRRNLLERAVRLYRGDLMPDCYDDWIAPERDRLRSRYIQALEELGWMVEEQREYTVAIPYAQQLLRTEPLHEAAHRRLMRLYVLNGDRAAALRTYHSCVTLLERELGVGPGEAIQEAYQRLLQQEAPAVLRHRSGLLGQNAVPLIGREAEWQTLLSRWRRSARGHAHFVLIAGEPGIGKTRLAEELLTWADRQGIGSVRARSYAAAGELAYAPVIDWLRLPMLQASLDEMDEVWLPEISRLLPEMQIAHPAQSRPGPVDESWQRRRLFEALANVVTVDGQPKLLLIDDLQWCDSETLAWLAYMMVAYPHTPLLIIGTIPTRGDRPRPSIEYAAFRATSWRRVDRT